MVFFNYSTMQMHAKVVYYGPGLCGKTTNLQYIYDHTGNDSRGEMVSLATETDRTLFFDLLPIDVGKIAGFTTRIQLYTVPGQVFYNTTRKLVLKGVDGVVFVADSQRPMLNANVESFENLEENLAEMGLDLETIPVVLQYNKRDLPNILTVEELDESLNKGNWSAVEASALNGDGVFETLKTISKATLIALKNRMTKGRGDSASKPKPAAAPGRTMPAAPPPRKGPLPAAPPPKADKAKPADEPVAVEPEEATAETTAPESQAPEPEARSETKSEVKLDDTVEAEPEVKSVEIDPDLAAAAGLKTTGTSAGMDPATGEAAPRAAAGTATADAEPVDEAVEIESPPELEPVEFETEEPVEAEPVAAEPPEAEPVEVEAAPEPEPVAAEPEPIASEPAAAPEAAPEPDPEPAPIAAAAAAAPAPLPAKKKKRRGAGVDVLAELEKLRKQTLDPRAARAARANGRQEIRRELDLGLGDAVSKARRFSLTLQVEDDEHRALLAEAHQLTVDIDRPGDVEQLMLRLQIALRSSGPS